MMRFWICLILFFATLGLCNGQDEEESSGGLLGELEDKLFEDMAANVNTTVETALGLIGGLDVDPARKTRYHKRMNKLREKANKVKGSGHYKKVRDVAHDVTSSFDDIFSGEPELMLKGFMTSAQSLTSYIPDPAGALVGGLVSIGMSWLGFDEPDMEELMEEMLDEKFKQLYKQLDQKFSQLQQVMGEKFDQLHTRLDFKFDEMAARMRAMQIQGLKQEFEGASMVIQAMHRNMQGMIFSDNIVNQADLDYLSSQVSSTAGLRVLGMLKVLILDLVEEADFSPYDSDAEKRFHHQASEIYALIRLYAYLTTIRKLLLVMARGIYIESNITQTAQDGLSLMISELDTYDKNWLKFLSAPRTEGQKYVVASYQANDEILELYFKQLGVDPFAANKKLAAKGVCNKLKIPRAKHDGVWQMVTCEGGRDRDYASACGFIYRINKCSRYQKQTNRFVVRIAETGENKGQAYLQTECGGSWKNVTWPDKGSGYRMTVGDRGKNHPAYFTFVKSSEYQNSYHAIRRGVGSGFEAKRHCWQPGGSLATFGQLTSCTDDVFADSALWFDECENS